MENQKEFSFIEAGIAETAKRAIGSALLHHKAVGNEIVYWHDGQLIREKLTYEISQAESKKSNKISALG